MRQVNLTEAEFMNVRIALADQVHKRKKALERAQRRCVIRECDLGEAKRLEAYFLPHAGRGEDNAGQ